jgi:murein L,D-transpeptidase YcbB/YkuD
MYENGVPVDSMKVIVGSDELPTPMIASVMYYVVYNPYWNAPAHLVRGPIAKKTLAGGMKYFKDKMGYEVMADWTPTSATIPAESVDWKAVAAGKAQYRIRQKPGPENFMGTLKFPFPNPEDIYLHDTPAKGHFNDANRAQSNGCVRLEDAQRFGRWLLGREPVPPGSEPEIQVQLQRPVPIYVTYITAQPGPQGLTFLKDEYGWDKPGAAQMAAAQMAASRVPRD